VGDRNLV